MSEDTTVRLNKELVMMMKHFAINQDTTLKNLIEEMIRIYAKKEIEKIKKTNPLLYAVIMAEEVEPYPDEILEIEEEKNNREERTYSAEEVKEMFGIK